MNWTIVPMGLHLASIVTSICFFKLLGNSWANHTTKIKETDFLFSNSFSENKVIFAGRLAYFYEDKYKIKYCSGFVTLQR